MNRELFFNNKSTSLGAGSGANLRATDGDWSGVWIGTAVGVAPHSGRHLSRSECKELRDFINERIGYEGALTEQRVIDAVVNFPGGCRDQKAAFLKSLGLEMPLNKTRFEVTIEHVGAGNWDPRDIESAVTKAYPHVLEAQKATVTAKAVTAWTA